MIFSNEVFFVTSNKALVKKVSCFFSEIMGVDPAVFDSSPQIHDDKEYFHRTWYSYALSVDDTNDISNCESPKWIELLEKCAYLLEDSGAIIIRFSSPTTTQTYAYTTPHGVYAGQGNLPDTWTEGFDDIDIGDDLINVEAEILPYEFRGGPSARTFSKRIEMSETYKSKIKKLFESDDHDNSNIAKSIEKYMDMSDEEFEAFIDYDDDDDDE